MAAFLELQWLAAGSGQGKHSGTTVLPIPSYSRSQTWPALLICTGCRILWVLQTGSLLLGCCGQLCREVGGMVGANWETLLPHQACSSPGSVWYPQSQKTNQAGIAPGSPLGLQVEYVPLPNQSLANPPLLLGLGLHPLPERQKLLQPCQPPREILPPLLRAKTGPQ